MQAMDSQPALCWLRCPGRRGHFRLGQLGSRFTMNYKIKISIPAHLLCYQHGRHRQDETFTMQRMAMICSFTPYADLP